LSALPPPRRASPTAAPTAAPWRGADAPPILSRRFIQRQFRGKDRGSEMAKKTRKQTASKATKRSKASTKKKGAKKKAAKKTAAIAKKQRKIAAPKKSTAVAKKKAVAKKPLTAKKALIAKKAPAGKKIRKPPPESFIDKVEDAITAIVDTITDAERLHRQLDPGVSREPE
jgi:hypothetical protein